jgi:hypothetical protein
MDIYISDVIDGYDPEDVKPVETMLGDHPKCMLSFQRGKTNASKRLLTDFLERFPYEGVMYDSFDQYKHTSEFRSRDDWAQFVNSL